MRFIFSLLGSLWFTWLVLGGQIAPRPPAGGAKAAARQPDLTVTGTFQGTNEDAYRSALEAAPDEVVAYLRQRGVHMEWRPTVADVVTLIESKDQIDGPDVGGSMRKVTLNLRIPAAKVAEMLNHDREYRSQQRMALLAKALAGLVAVLAAVAGYFRLDELTKGYYTGWLGLAAMGVVAIVVAATILLPA